jgi:16S rRNA (guanine1516-N2)-methyltransferase
LPSVRPRGGADTEDVVLQVSAEGLALYAPASGERPIRPETRHLAAGRRGRDDLLRAVLAGRSDGLRVVDATAGMGADGFLLAAAGARVTMVERSPVLYVLLRDALARASADPATAEAATRVTLRHGDAREVLRELEAPDVVYLDPMYPELGKSARKNKEMHLFRTIIGDDPDADDLLGVALSRAAWRVVVKRPAKAPPLAGRPSGAIRGRSVRFDLYPPAE